MQKIIRDQIGPRSNVRVSTYTTDGELVDVRESHNILTNIGRKWLRDISGALDYSATNPTSGFIEGSANVRTSERVRYIALGVGGLLTSDATIFNGTQEELVTVTSLEDFVQINSTPHYMKEVLPQPDGSDALPTNFSIRFITTILESEVSFAGNITKSGVTVGTLVKVSEAGLYLSGADLSSDPDDAANSTRLVAYNIFDPISITPNIVTRVEWEFRY